MLNDGSTTDFDVAEDDFSELTGGTPGNAAADTGDFTLELFHFADQEGNIDALEDAPRLSGVLNALEAEDIGDDGEADNTLILSSGDAFIPGVFFSASFNTYGGEGRADIMIQNELGVQAVALGNHEFDKGAAALAGLIAADAKTGYGGALFPYLSTNLDYSTDANLAPLEVAGGGSPLANTVTSSVVIETGADAEKVGVIGATTPTLGSISSPGDVTILPTEFGGNPSDAELDALAAVIQGEVDSLLANNPDMNKVVLLAHMQQISIEQELATRLSGVDIVVAGGSNTRLFDDNDTPRTDDRDQGQYPTFLKDADGNYVALVNTDGNYKYVGRLVLDFDADGNVIAESYDETVSGAYATDEAGLAAVGGEDLIDPEIEEIVEKLEAEIIAQDGNYFGIAEVFLNGTRESVRIQETNLGNLTADANLALAQEADGSVLVSIKNGGGVRNDIGETTVLPGDTEPSFLPPEGNELTGRPDGGISQTAISNALSFNNGLSLATLTRAELVDILEYGLEASSPDDTNTQGRFPQVSGVQFSFDLTADPGSRLVNAAITDAEGSDIDVLLRDGVLQGDGSAEVRIVTLGFLASGGDGYPFPVTDPTDPNYDADIAARVNRIDLDQEETAPRTGVADFAPDGSEQDALAEYLAANFDADNPYSEADTDRAGDTRMQNLAFAEDTVIDDDSSAGGVFFSEYVEGSSNNKAVEIFNNTGADIDLADYNIGRISNGGTDVEATIALSGTLAAGAVFVVANPMADAAILDVADLTSGTLSHNGDDHLLLLNGGTSVAGGANIIDMIGTPDDGAGFVDPGSSWTSGGNSTQNNTLIRNEGISEGNTDGFGSDLSGLANEWTSTGQDSFDDLGSHNGSGGEELPEPFPLELTALNTLSLSSGAEIIDFDPASDRAFISSGDGIQVVDASDPSSLSEIELIDPTVDGATDAAVTSVSVKNGILAAAVPGDNEQAPGAVFFYDTETSAFLGSVTVGALPDMVTFDETGTHAVVANEGEADDGVDPEGSISVITLNTSDFSASTVNTFSFGADVTFDALAAKGVRVFDSGTGSAAADLEPEYITIEGKTAFITVQEANAVAVIDDITQPGTIDLEDIQPLGAKDHSLPGNGLDTSDTDEAINIVTAPVKGLYMPDAIASYTANGQTYYVTANEGDARDEDERIEDLVLDPDAFPDAATLQTDEGIGRLQASTIDGDTDGDGDFDELYVYGARSFSIWDADGNQVFDSGDQFAQKIAADFAELHNSEGDADTFDGRSDNKGAEPEGVVVGEVEGRTFAFVGLERVGGVMVYDISEPENSELVTYVRTEGDIAPEGLKFISAGDSPTGTPILAVASEVSETLTFHEITVPVETPELTLISDIQGSTDFSALPEFAQVGVDDVSPFSGMTVTIEAVVTAIPDYTGFYVMEEESDWDADVWSSEGLFIYSAEDVMAGDLVRVTGEVSEYFGLTQLTPTEVTVVSSGNDIPEAVEVNFPTTGVMLDDDGNYVVDLEAYESMMITVPTEMSVTEMFNLDRFGQYTVTSGGQLEQFTQNNAPDADGYDQHLQDNAARSLVIDDGSSDSYSDPIEIIDGDNGILDAGDDFRMGDTLTNLTGVVDYSFDEFRLQDATGDYANTNPREEAPEDLGGNFKVASLNVLNYFTTLNDGSNSTTTGQGPRGANTAEELVRQEAKIVNAIVAMEADVVGLLEIENDVTSAPLATLVDAVNAELGSDVYGYIYTGQVGGDAITNALIYKTETANPLGDVDILDDSAFTDPLSSGGDLNRPAVTQTFEHVESGEVVTVSVNHLKSKGSLSGLAVDEDQGDGAGNNNGTREAAAEYLADHLATDPTGSGSNNILIVGDLNSYAQEDPINALRDQGYSDIAYDALGSDARSYVFDGQTGTLDYVMGSGDLLDDIAGVTEWHINADEADAIDYELSIRSNDGGFEFGTRNPDIYNGENAARNSDHDPVIVAFGFENDINLIEGNRFSNWLKGTDGDDRIVSGAGYLDVMRGRGGADEFVFGAETQNRRREIDVVRDYDDDEDTLVLTDGTSVKKIEDTWIGVTVTFHGDRDKLKLVGQDLAPEDLNFVVEDTLFV